MKKLHFVGLFVCSLSGSSQLLGIPEWWTDYSLTDGSTRQDNAIATLGQAKHAAQKGYLYLEAELAPVGGAGVEVFNLYSAYCLVAPENAQNDSYALTIGQLKYLAKPFYDRLNSADVGWDTTSMNSASIDIYPWTVDQVDDEDLSPATVGQLKFVFSFDLSGWAPPGGVIDSDGDGIPDNWEMLYYGNLDQGIYADWDADGITDHYEFLLGFDPLFPDALYVGQHSDGDGVADEKDAAPFDDAVGRVSISISTPLDGSTIQ
ncbi:MAG TPA: hypothetical protein DCX06_13230 [Opitutae bacterium]|nr:hypothetical protein [Opitutae bacterium]